LPLATWETAREIICCLLNDSSVWREGAVPLSNMKRLFRSRFGVELSETALGHSKLSELFQDARMNDVCEVQLRGHGYLVFPRHPVRHSSLYRGSRSSTPPPVVKPPPCESGPHTPPSTDVGSSSADSVAVPLSPEKASGQVFCADEPLDFEDDEWIEDTNTATDAPPTLSPFTVSKSGRVGSIVRNTFIHAASTPKSPCKVGTGTRARSVPKDLGSSRDSWEDTCNVLAFLPTAVSDSSVEEGSVHARTGTGHRGLCKVLSKASTRASSGSLGMRAVPIAHPDAVVVPPPVIAPGYEWEAPPVLETKYFEDGSCATLQPDGTWVVTAVGLPMLDAVVPPAPASMYQKPPEHACVGPPFFNQPSVPATQPGSWLAKIRANGAQVLERCSQQRFASDLFPKELNTSTFDATFCHELKPSPAPWTPVLHLDQRI